MRIKTISRRIVFLLIFMLLYQPDTFSQMYTEKYLHNQTVTYTEAIEFYRQLGATYEKSKLIPCGMTDAGKPLHLFVISEDRDFDPASLKKKNRRIVLINNAIHPGEPDGVDACMKLAEDVLKKNQHESIFRNTVLCIIPVYNIDGALNRGCCSRANQNGPEEYGFRGNAENLDLNRDFIKCEAMNTKSFTEIFREWDPDVFVDTHVSNGADYQYVMTLISSQHNKLTPALGEFIKNVMTPFLFSDMKKNGVEMSPYVDALKETPDDGITGFLEIPRFSSGYAALFNTLGFVPETHMFKPYKDRVEATYRFIVSVLTFTASHDKEIAQKRNEAKQECMSAKKFPLSWTLDTTAYETILFKGYEAKHALSKISGQQRLYYDRNAPFEKQIKFYDQYKADKTAEVPQAYIIPQAWRRVIERLQWNKIILKRLAKDTLMETEMYYITNYETVHAPYEGKYLHSKTEVRKEKQRIQYYAGDYIVELNQPGNRYIVETLEPEATDSYFNWGFFDAILQQKEYFSDYIFEDQAEEILKRRPELKAELEKRKSSDKSFAENHWEQLDFIYRQSEYYEQSHNRYPVGRILKQE